MKKILYGIIFSGIVLSGCTDNRDHLENGTLSNTNTGDWGIEGVMPTIGKIYIDKVEVQNSTDGGADMLKAHQKYTLSSDLIVDDYNVLAGGMCIWESLSKDTVFSNGKSTLEVPLLKNENTGSYECNNVLVDFKKDGTTAPADYEPDSVIRVSYTDNKGDAITQTTLGAVEPYSVSISLNVADRHNLKEVATSPSTVLFWRKDGIFQSGFTAYRGMLGLQKQIGSAIYEAKVKAPGGTRNVNPIFPTSRYESELAQDKQTIEAWLQDGDKANESKGIYSPSAFVSNYGPPIALPAFRKEAIDYNRLRTVLLRHNNYPLIISDDKKLYTMGHVTNFNSVDLEGNYSKHIRVNDIWFSYSGVDISSNPDLTKFHTGEIKTVNGVEAKFVSTVALTSDLDTTIVLNETDKEYYIAGNPNINKGFCENKADFKDLAFNYNKACGTYQSGEQVGAVKITGLQKILGDGSTAVATDTDIYYIGRDGKGYVINITPEGINGERIRQGLPVISTKVDFPHNEPGHNHGAEDWEKELYVVDMTYANMNHAVNPTLLLKDGSVVFTVRSYENGEIVSRNKHFYINKNPEINIPKHKDNIRIVKLLGPTLGYGEDGKIYFWSDIQSLGVSYAPKDKQTGTTDRIKDDDYLSFIYGDPIQLLNMMNGDKSRFFEFHYGTLDIDNRVKELGGTALGSNMAILPYNPYTAAIEDVLKTDNGYELVSLPYRPFRTNTHLIVNLNNNADKSYIYVPRYFYAFDNKDRVERDTWIEKQDGLMAAEVKDNNISKVYGVFSNRSIPFKYTPHGRNTTFFANKKGVFSFVDYNVRKTQSSCPGNETGCSIKFDKKMPDYFYRAKSSNNTILEESGGKNNYISTPFVTEVRMSNFPDTRDYMNKGFEPQLLSSWFLYEFDREPSDLGSNNAGDALLPGYVPQYWYENIKSRFTALSTKPVSDFLNGMYQYGYGVGLYRYYAADSFPVWRARKTNTEVLQYQARYGNLVPLSHGSTAESYFSNMVSLFSDGPQIDKPDLDKYVSPREYVHGLYAFYDIEELKGLRDIGAKVFGDLNTPMNDIATNGIGYIMVDGNFMWRNKTPLATGAGELSNFSFVLYHSR